MNICMAGLDHSLAPIALRERMSFTSAGVVELNQKIAKSPDCSGVVLLSTCNRMELYLSLPDGQSADPGAWLCEAAGVSGAEFTDAFVIRRGTDCARHLMEVACGLCSQILGEDQILTQVKTAVTLARQAGSADGVLETLFRTAAACGKTARSGGRISGVPTSVAHRAVEVLREQMGELAGKSALVIGNGEMGRLSASLLREAGCQVTVTLRSYHHGQTVVPAGCEVVPYEARYEAMEGMDLLLSATTSPHYTVNLAAFAALARPPRMLVDLAIPRDIQPELAQQAGVTLLNVDHLRRQDVVDANAMKRVQAAVEEYLERFLQWNTYRESLPAQEELKQALRKRMRAYLEAGMDAEEAMELTVEKTVELIAGGLNDTLPAHAIRECAARIRQHTRA